MKEGYLIIWLDKSDVVIDFMENTPQNKLSFESLIMPTNSDNETWIKYTKCIENKTTIRFMTQNNDITVWPFNNLKIINTFCMPR